jgi:hypothetical protein
MSVRDDVRLAPLSALSDAELEDAARLAEVHEAVAAR